MIEIYQWSKKCFSIPDDETAFLSVENGKVGYIKSATKELHKFNSFNYGNISEFSIVIF